MKKPKKPIECDACGFGTKRLVFWEGQGHAGTGDKTSEDVPWILRSKWLCRLCSTGVGFEVQQGRVNHGIVQAMNVILEALEPRA